MSIQVSNVSKHFGPFAAVDKVSLEVGSGELVALLGPSGSGKTTLLRMIAGLELPDSGTIVLSGEDVAGRSVQQRAVGFVFQHYALFRHMTLFENVAFGLRVRRRELRPSDADIRSRVMRLLEMVQLDRLAGRYPHQLSGGQRQRVALARALAIEPKVLLLDEPFGALDARVRKELRRWLRRLHDEIHLTSVFVTHDQEEALEVADRIAVFNKGRIEQVGAPDEVYDHPATAFVHQFLGHTNRFQGVVSRGVANISGTHVDAHEHADVAHAPAVVYVRPHDLDIVAEASNASFAATLNHTVKLGPVVRLELTRRDGGEPVEVELPRPKFAQLDLVPGGLVHLKPRRARVFIDERNSTGPARGTIDDREVPRVTPAPAPHPDAQPVVPARAA
ncbi:MAG: sulfate transporter, ATPase subunit [Betaproteobacteria bacterium]|jgi:sulfate transport system ATP-binding protein|nr:sulfate transporter, ATPase subunit [Betaproteobacteria bacterium]